MKALFAGSFDPFTTGHLSIVERALRMFDHIVVAIGRNEHKTGEWDVDERVKVISALFENNPRVEVTAYRGLTAKFAQEIGADSILRSIRNVADFEYERNLADANLSIFGIDTVFLMASPEQSFISSSLVRELIHNGYDPSKYIAGDFKIPSGNNKL